MSLSLHLIKNHFPFIKDNSSLIYFDNAATTHKPVVVLNALKRYYSKQNSNVHRGVHKTSQLATNLFEESREKVALFFNAKHSSEIIFTSGTTDSINIVADSFSSAFLNKGDEILISGMEHHSNIVPWQFSCKKKEAKLKILPFNAQGDLILKNLDSLLNKKTKLVALNHVSNSLGTINDIKLIIQKAHRVGAKVLIDGAQAAAHMKIDLQDLDCDFYCISAHKMYGPTGVGVLYGKRNLLDLMPPCRFGGEMIKKVSFKKTTFTDVPHKFEAGTPNIAGVIAFKEAIDFLLNIGYPSIQNHEKILLEYATKELEKLDAIFYGSSNKKASLVSFLFKNIHPYDFGVILDKMKIAVRTGHHCTQPVMDYFKIPGTIRASFSIYNTIEEIDTFILACKKAKSMLS